MNRLLFAIVVLLVGAALVGGFIAVGGPQQARLEGQDRERLSDLRRLASAASCKPGTFEDADAPGCELLPDTSELRDPATGAAYVRHLRPDGLLEVCADLATDPERSLPQYEDNHAVDGQTVCLRYRLVEGRWLPV